MPLYTFQSEDGDTIDLMFDYETRPDTVCDDEGVEYHYVISPVRYANIVSTHISRDYRKGFISKDQMERQQEQLVKRSEEWTRSKQGQEQRDRNLDRLVSKGQLPKPIADSLRMKG